jgi:hypothetical protein
MSRKGENTVSMALLIQASIGPSRASISRDASNTVSAFATSTSRAMTLAPKHSNSGLAASSEPASRARMPIDAPDFAKRLAVARPTPAEAPVMTTTLSAQ